VSTIDHAEDVDTLLTAPHRTGRGPADRQLPGDWTSDPAGGGIRWRRNLPTGPQLGQAQVGGQPATAQ
jgi:hypothetical protein